LSEEEHPGVAAYLRFIDEPDGKGIRGALFIMSTRGDPLEFSFTRIDLRSSVLWRAGRARSRAVTSLTKALFESASHVPDVVFALANETPAEVFSEDLGVQIPVCMIATQGPGPGPPEEAQHPSDSVSLIWVNGQPAPGGASSKMVEALGARGLLLEPFDRAALGIQEAFES
jgi:hypothetical protein